SHIVKSTNEYSVSHVLFHCTANGGQPRTPVVIIYLRRISSSFLSFNSYSKDAPTIVWVAHSWGYRVPLPIVSNLVRHCGTFIDDSPYLERLRLIISR